METKPYYPRTLEIAGYVQLFHEVAERISDGRTVAPVGLREQYREIYEEKGHKDPQDVRGFSDRDFMMFSELSRPDTKKKMLNLFRREYDEVDIREVINDRRALAAIDSYGRGLIDLTRVKEFALGATDAYPRDLSFLAFQKLCLEVVRRIKSGSIIIPIGLQEIFPEIYNPSFDHGS